MTTGHVTVAALVKFRQDEGLASGETVRGSGLIILIWSFLPSVMSRKHRLCSGAAYPTGVQRVTVIPKTMLARASSEPAHSLRRICLFIFFPPQ
jgi:hypothetical protein